MGNIASNKEAIPIGKTKVRRKVVEIATDLNESTEVHNPRRDYCAILNTSREMYN